MVQESARVNLPQGFLRSVVGPLLEWSLRAVVLLVARGGPGRAWPRCAEESVDHREPDADKRLVLVGSIIEEMKQNCIPPDLFEKARHLYPSWWETHQREQKSAAGKKGQEVKQARAGSSEDAMKGTSETPVRDSGEETEENQG
jgi:hypothetical protein